ncbi:MAG: lycopene cyclase domain-containing protein [Cyclobacteriaceae bacterium]|nr:lycopene cyclase domain-containing protein [Cyclobacteriaceae bacterium]
MLETKYLYLLLNLFAWFPPMSLSFDRKVAYFSRWKYLMPSILIVGILFIAWDILFTRWAVWGFNDTYLTGIKILYLPLEEWMFFLTIPFASVFIYDCIKAYFPQWKFSQAGIWIALFLAAILIMVGVLNLSRWYTSVTFILLSCLLFYLGYRKVDYLGRFFISYLIILIPFFIVNGILTGSAIQDEVVWYNDQRNLGIRLLTIPVEDVFYGMLLVLGNIVLYEYFKSKRTA